MKNTKRSGWRYLMLMGLLAVAAASLPGCPIPSDLLVVDPVSLDFGDTETKVSIQLHNNGGAALPWDSETGAAWLSLQPGRGELAPKGTVKVWVTCDRELISNHLNETSIVFSTDGFQVTVMVHVKRVSREGEAEVSTDEGEDNSEGETEAPTDEAEDNNEGEAEAPTDEAEDNNEGEAEAPTDEAEDNNEGEAEVSIGEGGSDEGEGTPVETETFTLPGGVPLTMVRIEPGTYLMGRYPGERGSESDEVPQHAVTFASGFWLGMYEVTIGQYLAYLRTARDESGVDWSDSDCPITRDRGTYALRGNDFGQSESQPMAEVSWFGAQGFCAWVARETGLPFRLPTEAEWEYACRAGTETRFYWGDDPDYTAIDDYAWWNGLTVEIDENYTHLVGQKLANAWGLYDMIGNVWEWGADDWKDYYTGAPSDGSAWIGSPRAEWRVTRGGGYGTVDYQCRSANRGGHNPLGTSGYIGLRLAR